MQAQSAVSAAVPPPLPPLEHATQGETAAETRTRWREWSAFAVSSSSVMHSTAGEGSSSEDGDDAPPSQRHPLEVAATERFLAADLLRRVLAAQGGMPPLTTEEKTSLPAWMSWGRGSTALGARWIRSHDAAAAGDEDEGGSPSSAAPALCAPHYGDSLSAAMVAAARLEDSGMYHAASPRRGIISRAMRKVSKRLPHLRIVASASASFSARLPANPFSKSRSTAHPPARTALPQAQHAYSHADPSLGSDNETHLLGRQDKPFSPSIFALHRVCLD